MLKRLTLIALLASLAVSTTAASAQEPAPDARRVEATRQDLQALLTNTKLTAEERRAVDTRLREGDCC